ncbi:MAG: oxamate carbamoyltransferase [Burkholderiales bacterium]|jgi:aspartyl-tRNA(Asn)/glutamyl-tRNA(Gln) amidotransferase subunit A
MNTLRDVFAGYADWLGYGHEARADAWLKRLEINEPELNYFRTQPHPLSPAYRAVAPNLSPPDGYSVGDEPRPPADAAAALLRARNLSGLNAFTWLADKVVTPKPGILSGVPIAVKDLMAVAGVPLTGGSAAVDPITSTHDAEVVARLKDAGAVIIGTTNLHELAYGITSDNPHFGRVANPVALDHMPGGSSGGSAAAIAAGIVHAAVGTDTAGSIRVPAACCGIVGFKPSYDVLPRTGVMDLAPSLDHVGPMGRSVETCARLFMAMLGLPEMPDWTYRNLSGRTFARLTGYFEWPLDPEVHAASLAAMAALKKDGASCTEAEVDGIEAAGAIQFNTICAEATEVHAQLLQLRGERIGEDVRVRLEIGHFLPGHWYVKAQRMRQQLADRIDTLFLDADFLVCPTMRTPAPLIDAGNVDIGGRLYPLHTAVTNLTMPFNLTGLPAISVPWSANANGVPIGMQIIGRRGADCQVLAVARRLELASPWYRHRIATI